jgi:putative oxygen-independent coproporphyrinogen III oxidase
MTSEPSGLYVHVPYCIKKCDYCDFFSEVRREDAAWVGAVEREFDTQRERFGPFVTVYLGGGTPSSLDPSTIARMLDFLPHTPGAEVTLEVNPDDVTVGRALAWMAAGVNRISLGVQSLRDERLAFLGRRHDATAAVGAVAAIRDAGCDNLGLDLIYGLPGDDFDVLTQELDALVALQPEHLSCYELTVAGGTPLAAKVARGIVALPGEDQQQSLFLHASATLRERGFEHYEISSFAWEQRLRSRHNGAYWSRRPYLGLGPSAHSFDGERRWWNVATVDDYLERVVSDGSAIEEAEQLSGMQAALEQVMLGLRTADGCERSLLRRWAGAEDVAAGLDHDGLVTLTADRIRPTLAGMAMADRLPLLLTCSS